MLVTGLPFNPLALLLAFGMGIVVTLAPRWFPRWRAARVSPMDALRPSRQPGRTLGGRLRWIVVLELVVVLLGVVAYPVDRGDFGVRARAGARASCSAGALLAAILLQPLSRVVGRPFEWFFGAEGLLGRANLGRDRARTGLTVGALIIALASVVTLGVVADTAGATADRWVNSVLPGGYAIRLGLPVDIDTIRRTCEHTGDRSASCPSPSSRPWRRPTTGRARSARRHRPHRLPGHRSLIFVAGERRDAFKALHDGGAVLLPEPIARRDGLGSATRSRWRSPARTASPSRWPGSSPTRCPRGPPRAPS